MNVKARGGIAGGDVMCGQRHDSGAVSHPAVQSRPLRDAIDYRMQEAESDATQRSESRRPGDRDGGLNRVCRRHLTFSRRQRLPQATIHVIQRTPTPERGLCSMSVVLYYLDIILLSIFCESK